MPRIAPAEPPYEPAIADALQRIMPPGMRAAGAVPHHGQKPARLRQDVRRRPAGQRPAQPAPARDRDRPHHGAAGLRIRMGRAHRLVRRARSASARPRSPPRCTGRPMPPAGRPRSRRCSRWSTISSTGAPSRDATWSALAAHFDEAQILEAIALVGYYHTISFLCRGLEPAARKLGRALSGSKALQKNTVGLGRRDSR